MTTKTSKPGPLGTFEGDKVTLSTAALKQAGDGLSKSMAINPVAYPEGYEFAAVVRVKVGQIAHKRIKDSTEFERKHDLNVQTFVPLTDESAVAHILEDHQRKIEELDGIVRLDFEDGDDGDGE